MSLDNSIETLRSLGKKWETAWNQHDIAGLAALIAEDGDFVTVGGRWLRGRKEFKEYHAGKHDMVFKDSIWTTTDTQVRFLRQDLSIVHVMWQIRGDRDPDGTPRQPRDGIFTWTVSKKRGKWLIDAAQNTNMRQDLTRG